MINTNMEVKCENNDFDMLKNAVGTVELVCNVHRYFGVLCTFYVTNMSNVNLNTLRVVVYTFGIGIGDICRY